MYDIGWKLKIVEVGYKMGRDLYIFRRVGGKTEIMQPDGTIKTFNEGEVYDAVPFMEMDTDMLQQFSDELSKNGFKPQKGFIEGKLDAVEKHLEDMRTLVFKIKK